MTKLDYTFTNDALFKMLFVKYPNLLKNIITELLAIPLESIGHFFITSQKIPPEALGDKFCRLDINITVDDRRVEIWQFHVKCTHFTWNEVWRLSFQLQ
ncbi:MAG: hypothetical protein LBH03_03425 [Holophagales bacterium]|nr:hypothetical protein [Holophagales bacterium]